MSGARKSPAACTAYTNAESAFPGTLRETVSPDATAVSALRQLHSAEAGPAVLAALRIIRNAGGATPWNPLVAAHVELLEWADWLGILEPILAGERTGYRWAPCSRCGRGMLRERKAADVGCKMTPGCEGQHQVTS